MTAPHIGILGLGYVGLPLAVAFGKRYQTVGFDLDATRIAELNAGIDVTREVESDDLAEARQLRFSHTKTDLAHCTCFIVAVPTPIDAWRRPDLHPLRSASEIVGEFLKPGDIVIYESTVYPGATEEVCVPILEKVSGLRYNQDFFCGYSPERINPGDKAHRLTDIVKITSGSTEETATRVDELYGSIITAGTYRAGSIAVAEAAKVIENTQRDVNIALVNELALIFDRLNINTAEVLAAAATKWNFLPFKPGLVGGHCIGVDPYYLTHKAQEIGYHPEMILAGRRINDAMGSYVAQRVIKLMLQKDIEMKGAEVLVLGLSFKENCPDLRNTRVIDIINELSEYGLTVSVYDPWVSSHEAWEKYHIKMLQSAAGKRFDAVVLAVAHEEFVAMTQDQWQNLGKARTVLFDVKGILPRDLVDGAL
jgi:UDP-N-acetyl-D-galactosamine dehydrogenase